MEEMNKESGPVASANSDTAPEPKGQLFAGAVIAVAALSVVMLLLLLAVRRAPSAVVAHPETKSGEPSPEVYAGKNIAIEGLEHDLRTGATGLRELEIKGYVRNTGDKTVGSAVLRCYFKTYSDTETFLDIPLIVATRLEDMDCGPLKPLSGRRFDVRFGDFPENLQSGIERYELIHVSFLAL